MIYIMQSDPNFPACSTAILPAALCHLLQGHELLALTGFFSDFY